MAEVYAGFSEYTDAQVGRIVDYLEESGQLDNTIIFYCADNGASGEGSPNGSVNEGKFFNGYPDDIEENLTMIDQLGSPDTYNHYPTGWAMAFSTPYRMFKRYSLPGRRVRSAGDPLAGRHQGARARCASSTTTAPTSCRRSSSAAASRCPKVVNGVRADAAARRVDALLVRRRRRADAEGDPVLRDARAPAASGTRAGRPSPSTARSVGSGKFEKDRWQLFHTDVDRSEAHDLADEHPEKLEELKALWLAEAKATTCCRSTTCRSSARGLRDVRRDGVPRSPVPPSGQYTYYPGTTEIPERSAANAHNVSYKVLAEVELTADTEGVIFAHGSRFGGYALFVKDGKLTYVYNFLGIPPEQRIAAPAPTSGTHIVGVEFTKERDGRAPRGASAR